MTHPDISDAGVIGIYNEDQATELPRAYVVLSAAKRSSKTASEAESIIKWVSERVANHKKLRGSVIYQLVVGTVLIWVAEQRRRIRR